MAYVLQRAGDPGQAEVLLDASYEFIQDMPRLGWWGGYWISDVRILALRGRIDEAVNRLQRAHDAGWQTLWWYYLRNDPIMEPVISRPELKRLRNKIEAEMSTQMQRVRELEDRGQIKAVPGVKFG